MASDASVRSVGFWRGFLAGLGVAALGLLALALAYPPVPAAPPALAPEAAIAPAPPARPVSRSAPVTGVLGPAAPGPLVSDRPAATPTRAPNPSLAPISPPTGGTSGPSLIPRTQD